MPFGFECLFRILNGKADTGPENSQDGTKIEQFFMNGNIRALHSNAAEEKFLRQFAQIYIQTLTEFNFNCILIHFLPSPRCPPSLHFPRDFAASSSLGKARIYNSRSDTFLLLNLINPIFRLAQLYPFSTLPPPLPNVKQFTKTSLRNLHYDMTHKMTEISFHPLFKHPMSEERNRANRKFSRTCFNGIVMINV